MFYDQAQARGRRDRAARIADVNAATVGSKEGKALFDALSQED